MNRGIRRQFALFAYYAIAQYLPTQPIPGWRLAYWARRKLVRAIFLRCGDGVVVKTRAYFGSGSRIQLGSGSQLGVRCRIDNDTIFGDQVVMGPDVIIMSSSHAFERVDVPVNRQGALVRRPVRVEDDVWIGTRAIILPGVTIGAGAIIGAGAVVTKSVEAFAIMAGNPARKVRSRGERL